MASIINATVTSPGGLVTTGDNTNELKIQTGETDALTVSSSQVVTFNNPIVVGTNAINAENSLGFRNRIINGDMRIDQRNAGASVTNTGNDYYLDRWKAYGNVSSKFSVQQNAGSVTPPVGYTNYLGITSLSAYSVGSSDQFRLQQLIEGFNVADLGFGTANAKTITLSFWVRSSLTGTFGGALNNSGYARSYPFTYTVSSANTWEQKSITIAGDTSGTWLTTNGQGLILNFGLGAGSTLSGTAGSWASATYTSATGATSVVGTNGATFYITGVQLEVGSVATPFERRPYGTELQLCQRYYEKSYPIETVPGTASIQGASWLFASSTANGYLYGTLWFKVTKRTNATMNFWSYGGTANVASDGNITNLVAGSADTRGQNGTQSSGIGNFSGGTISPAGGNISVHWVASAEL